MPAAALLWSKLHGANPALQRRMANKASVSYPGNGDRKMGTYAELVQRIRWHAKALITGYAIVRAAAVACAKSFVVAACGGAAGPATTGTQSPAAAATATSSAAPRSGPASASVPLGASAAAQPAESATTAPAQAITPEEAENGLIKGELAHNWAQACSYIVPSTQPICNQAAQNGALPIFTGQATVAGDAISGSEALVAVTGSMCGTTTGCASNSDPSAGMPSSKVTFAQAYEQALNKSNSLSPVACIEENGRWYINAAL
jgi:hypothetical protein